MALVFTSLSDIRAARLATATDVQASFDELRSKFDGAPPGVRVPDLADDQAIDKRSVFVHSHAGWSHTDRYIMIGKAYKQMRPLRLSSVITLVDWGTATGSVRAELFVLKNTTTDDITAVIEGQQLGAAIDDERQLMGSVLVARRLTTAVPAASGTLQQYHSMTFTVPAILAGEVWGVRLNFDITSGAVAAQFLTRGTVTLEYARTLERT